MKYTEINIHNYRGIRTCLLKNLGLVNVLFGKNNCGKSSVLEAVFLMSGPSNPTMPIIVNNLRNLVSFAEEDIKTDFYGLNTDNGIHITSEGECKRDVTISMIESHSNQITLDQINQLNAEHVAKRYGFKVEFIIGEEKKDHHTELIIAEEDGNARAITDKNYKETLYAEYIPSGYMMLNINDKLSQVIKSKEENEILEALRIVEPKIKDIQLLDKKVMVDIGLSSRLPINVLGDGVRKVLAILLSIHSAKNGVLMIDEIDNGLHYSVMKTLWRVILHTCQKQNTQLFVSTHSLDMLKALVSVTEEGAADHVSISSYKLLRKEDDELATLRYDKETLAYIINQEMEVR